MATHQRRTMSGWITKQFEKIVTLIPEPILRKVINKLQRVQGFGSGATDIHKEAFFALKLLGESKENKKITVLDIGANIGNYSSAILKLNPFVQIYAWEPSLFSFNKYKSAFANYENVHVYKSALGKSHGVVKLFWDSPGSGLASMTKRKLDHFGINFDSSEQIELSTLNSWYEVTGIIPQIIKVDVEGHEMDVFVGADSLIRKVKVIQFEFGGSNIDTRTYFQDFWYFFKNLNFELFRLGNNKLYKVIKYDEQDENFRVTNYYAVNKNTNN